MAVCGGLINLGGHIESVVCEVDNEGRFLAMVGECKLKGLLDFPS